MPPLKSIVLVLLLGLFLGILAFGPRAGEELPRDRVIVDYWEKWTAAEERQMRSIIDEFNATVGREKGIYVRYLSTSAINHKTLIATAAGVPPDIAGLWDGNIVQFAELDALEPLEAMAAEHGITSATYKDVYWRACNYDGHLYALVSTPGVVALHYNRVAFEQYASELRAEGLDPTRAPRTMQEFDRYADALTRRDANGRILSAGYLPWEPDWYLAYMSFWFGGSLWDPVANRITLTDPGTIAAYEWIASYARKLGKDAMANFRGGFGTFDSPQNPFITGTVRMEQQGPWMPNYIDHQRPDLQRLKFSREVEMTLPREQRKQNYFWSVAPFPSAVPGLEDVSYCTFDALVIPRRARHKKEAFEFIAYLQRQDVMERLCSMHCKNSPLASVSESFLDTHPNPYIDVFERLARSPNARSIPQCPIWPEVFDELNILSQRLTVLQADPATALREAEVRLQAKYELFMEKQRARGLE